jgi:AraC-like DNA-binding protein
MPQPVEMNQGGLLLTERIAVHALKVYAQSFGTIAPLLSEMGKDTKGDHPIEDVIGRMPIADVARLTTLAVRDLAAYDGRLYGRGPLRPSDWRVVLYSLSGASTLRGAIQRCSDCFEAIDWRCGRMALRSRGNVAELELDAMRAQKSASACIVALVGIAQIHGLLSWLIGRPLPVLEVWLDHGEAEFRALGLPDLPFTLRLQAGRSGFSFAAPHLDHPVVRTAEEMAERPAQAMLFGAGYGEASQPPISDQVRRIALTALRDSQRLPAFEDIVAAVGSSEATLRRRLAREGVSYRQIKDSCRRELALDMLRRSTLPIEDIAARLDFCDSDAFRRAFREWLGISPTGYRREARMRAFETVGEG